MIGIVIVSHENIAKEFNNLFIISNRTNKDNLFNQLDEYYKNINSFNKENFVQNYTPSLITKILDLS